LVAAEGWQQIDPFIPACLHSNRPVSWAEVLQDVNLTKEQRAYLNELNAFGMHSGIVFPVPAPQGKCNVVAISRHHRDRPDPLRIPYLQALCIEAARRHQQLSDMRPHTPRAPLSTRELDVLKLMKNNVPLARISQRLNITIRTADFYIASVVKKLDAATRVEAVVRGIKEGLIER
jgi:DNA-binding CsgD family transcriptional regulator